jgi:F-type H+-transporting ATPase subunit epsilon
MQLEIITPETIVFSGHAKSVSLPGSDGVFQLLPNHAPIISSLQQGFVKVELGEGSEIPLTVANVQKDTLSPHSFLLEVKGGVVEMLHDKVIVLID